MCDVFGYRMRVRDDIHVCFVLTTIQNSFCRKVPSSRMCRDTLSYDFSIERNTTDLGIRRTFHACIVSASFSLGYNATKTLSKWKFKSKTLVYKQTKKRTWCVNCYFSESKLFHQSIVFWIFALFFFNIYVNVPKVFFFFFWINFVFSSVAKCSASVCFINLYISL